MKTKKVLTGILLLFTILFTGAALYLNTLLPIITGYAAKNLCSAVFVASRKQADVEAVDLHFSFIKYTKNRVDNNDKSVTSRFLWKKSKAIYREGFGVTLLSDVREDELKKEVYPVQINPGYSQDTIKWPLGNIIPDTLTGIDRDALNAVSKHLIDDSGSYNGNAFGFVVLHKGIPVAERYKPEFNIKTRFLSWSMAKSFTNAMVGILVKEGRMDLAKPVGLKDWENDDRSKITLNDLLQMQSGLKWNEDYGNRSSVNIMLHCEGDMGQYAFDQPFEYTAGTKWYYSSGTSNIVSYLIRKQFSNDSLYYKFIHNELFNKIGIPDALMEVDPSGTMVASSYLYASARDYARFGLLYLNDGVFNGVRILPDGWVAYTTKEASDSKGEYGAFFWLNKGKKFPSAPEDMYSCAGHDGQKIFIIPSKDLVVVVVGYSPSSNGGMDFDSLLKDILMTIPV
jgi:CubicO group peptidase (beta-lactamase class C family)